MKPEKFDRLNKKNNLLLVTDMQCKDENKIRYVPIDGVYSIRADGKVYKVNHEEKIENE